MDRTEKRKKNTGDKYCMKIIYKNLEVLHYYVTYVLMVINISTLRKLETV